LYRVAEALWAADAPEPVLAEATCDTALAGVMTLYATINGYVPIRERAGGRGQTPSRLLRDYAELYALTARLSGESLSP